MDKLKLYLELQKDQKCPNMDCKYCTEMEHCSLCLAIKEFENIQLQLIEYKKVNRVIE